MMIKKDSMRLGILILLILTFIRVQGQQDPQFTQYMFNTMRVNPAYAGSRLEGSLMASGRAQWLGLNGAPNTQSLSYERAFEKRIGLGVNLTNDTWGPSSEIYLDVNTSYTIDFSHKGKLAFGLKLGGRSFNVDWSKGSHLQQPDENFAANVNKFFPTLGFGVYYYQKNYYWGLSVPNFLNTSHFDTSVNRVSNERVHLFFISGYVFDFRNDFKFKPAILAKAVSGSPLSFDISGSVYYKDRLWGGLSYRLDDSIAAILGFKINERMDFGYSYDLSTSGLQNYNSGSHEVILKYIFKRNVVNRLRCF